MPTPDICDAPSGVELLDDTVKGRQPVRYQARVVTGPEEPFGASEQARVVLTPFHAGAASEVLHGSLLNSEEVLHDRVAARQIHRSVRTREAQRLFLAQV